MLAYVSGPPEASIGPSGNVLIHIPVNDDEMVTLSFRTPGNFEEHNEQQLDVYRVAAVVASERAYPQLFDQPKDAA